MSRTILLAFGVALAAAPSGAPSAGSVQLRATLNVRNERVVSNHAGGHGAGRFTATIAGRQMTWRLTFSRLSSPPIAAHIHLGRFDQIGRVLVGLCTSGEHRCVSATGGVITRNWSAIIRAAKAERIYVDIHTRRRPDGEIRGQLVRVRG